MKMNRACIAWHRSLSREEAHNHFLESHSIVCASVRIDGDRTLENLLEAFDIAALLDLVEAVLGMFFDGLEALHGFFEISPRKENFLFIWKMKDYVALLTSALWVELDTAILRVLNGEPVDAETLEILISQDAIPTRGTKLSHTRT